LGHISFPKSTGINHFYAVRSKATKFAEITDNWQLILLEHSCSL